MVEQQEAVERQLEEVQEQEALMNSQKESVVKPHIQNSVSLIDTMVPAGTANANKGIVQEPTIEDMEEFKENVKNQRETLLPGLDIVRAKTNDTRDNKFRSLYSFQTFKWLILQTQAASITIEDLVRRISILERRNNQPMVSA